METDADRLECIKELGGQLISCESGELWAIYDAGYEETIGIEGVSPSFRCRTSDVVTLQLSKGAAMTTADARFKVRRHEPDGTGMSRLVLDK